MGIKAVKKLALMLLLAALPASSWAAIAVGQHAVNVSAAFSPVTTISTPSKTTSASGSTFVILLWSTTTVASSTPVSDATTGCTSPCNTYTLKASSTAIFGGINLYVYVTDNATGGAGHVATANLSASAAVAILFVEITGAANPSYDTSNTFANNSNASSQAGASVTTTAANDLVLSLFGTGNNTTIGDASGWSAILDQSNPSVTSGVQSAVDSYKIQATTGAVFDTYSMSPADFSGGITVAFKQGAGAVVNGPVISNGHPVKSGSSVLYK